MTGTGMTNFQWKDRKTFTHHLVDCDTGIEIIEKGWEYRQKILTMSGEDLDESFTFILRDPRYKGPLGQTDIEFTAARLGRTEESTIYMDRVIQIQIWYGFAIDTGDFNARFSHYAGGDEEKLASLREYVRGALLYYLDGVRGPIVHFK
jgi:hypothetical protein